MYDDFLLTLLFIIVGCCVVGAAVGYGLAQFILWWVA